MKKSNVLNLTQKTSKHTERLRFIIKFFTKAIKQTHTNKHKKSTITLSNIVGHLDHCYSHSFHSHYY